MLLPGCQYARARSFEVRSLERRALFDIWNGRLSKGYWTWQVHGTFRIDTNHCKQYLNREHSNTIEDSPVILTVHLPYESLRRWSDAVCKCSLRYVDVVNAFLRENSDYQVKTNCHRVENRLEKACYEVKRKFVGKNGAAPIDNFVIRMSTFLGRWMKYWWQLTSWKLKRNANEY